MSNLLEQLRQPFPPDAISWLPGATTKDGSKCMAMAYGDLRAYMERLDDVCGMDWAVRYVFWGDRRIACELTISGVTRSSTGEYDAQDEKSNIAGTVAEAQAFKRAAAMFGLGRYLYDLPAAWVAFDAAAKKISKEGQNELDKRYRDWYQRTVAASAKKRVPVERIVNQDTGEIVDNPVSGDVLFAKPEPPTEDELVILGNWHTPKEAQAWAVTEKYCKNEHHARESFEQSVVAHGGKLNKENIAPVYLHFLRHQLSKRQPA